MKNCFASTHPLLRLRDVRWEVQFQNQTCKFRSGEDDDFFFPLREEREMRSEFFLSSFHKKRGESFLSQLSLLKTCLFSTRKHHARASGGAEEASAARQGSRRAAAAAREARRRRDGGEEECSHSQEEQRCQLRRQWPRQRNILASCSRHRPGHARHLWRISLRREHDSHRGPCSGAEVCNSRDARRRKRLFSSDGVSPPPFNAPLSFSLYSSSFYATGRSRGLVVQAFCINPGGKENGMIRGEN